MTGLPFVWAFWAGRPEAAVARDGRRCCTDAAEPGVAARDAIAAAYCREMPERIPLAQRVPAPATWRFG